MHVKLRLVYVVDGTVLVPAATLTAMLRALAEEVSAWPDQGADPTTVGAFREMLGRVADTIDVDCISLTSDLVAGRQQSGRSSETLSRRRLRRSLSEEGSTFVSATIPTPPDPDVVPDPGHAEPPVPLPPDPDAVPRPGPDPDPLPYPDPEPARPAEPPAKTQPQPEPAGPGATARG